MRVQDILILLFAACLRNELIDSKTFHGFMTSVNTG